MANAAAVLLLLTCALTEPALAAPTPTLGRVRLNVRDLPAALSWLDKVMDWKPSFRGERRALLTSGTAKLELDAADADSAATLTLVSEDADADYLRMLARGAVSIDAPSDRPSGFREASVRGPGALIVAIEGPLSQSPEFVYTEIAPGSGETPKPSDTVRVRYVGTLKDGTIFDEGHRKGRPALVPLPSAVRCWTQALTRMKTGGRSKFSCPPDLAYGKAGRPPRIPPNATLLFELELVGVLR
ncbi:MAG: FKBP-type peptidyl-prolyl cis-trans isomerase [Elusimicrobiota bacterium]